MAERTVEGGARRRDGRQLAALPISQAPWASERRLYGDPEQASMPPRITSIREVVAVIDRRGALESAIEDLESNGFDRSQISLLATRDVIGQLAQSADPEALPIASADTGGAPVALTGDVGGGALTGAPAAVAGMVAASTTAVQSGPLAGIGVTALPATGGADALGGIFAKLFPVPVADHFQEQIVRGGVLVWVSLPHPEREATAREILGRHAGEVRAYRSTV